MEVREQYGDDVEIIGLPGLSSDLDAMIEFVESTGSDGVTHVLDPTGELWARFGVTQQRTYVYVNNDGEQQISGYGSLGADVEALIAR